MLTLDTDITLLALALGIGLAGWMYYLEKHPPGNFRPRLFPTTPFLFIGGLIALGAAMHLMAALGIKPPPPQP
jgi:CHASE1-domain containing sensor protein